MRGAVSDDTETIAAVGVQAKDWTLLAEPHQELRDESMSAIPHKSRISNNKDQQDLQGAMKMTHFLEVLASAILIATGLDAKHADSVTAIAFSTDGKVIVSGSLDRSIRLWEANGHAIGKIDSVQDMIWSVALAPDNRTLVSGGSDRTLCVYDISTSKLIRRFDAHEKLTTAALAFSQDGRILASGGENKKICLWDTKTWNLLGQLEGFAEAITCIQFSPDGKIVAASSWDKSVRIYDVGSRKLLHVLSGHRKGVGSIGISRDGRLLASGGEDGIVLIWDIASAKEILRLQGPKRRVCSVAFSDDGKVLAAAGWGLPYLCVWKAGDEFKQVNETWPVDGEIRRVRFSPDGKTLALGTEAGPILRIDMDTGKLKN